MNDEPQEILKELLIMKKRNLTKKIYSTRIFL
mgnify:CR=1 FL=1